MPPAPDQLPHAYDGNLAIAMLAGDNCSCTTKPPDPDITGTYRKLVHCSYNEARYSRRSMRCREFQDCLARTAGMYLGEVTTVPAVTGR